MVVKNITAKKILASLGDYTVEASIEFADGSKAAASVPAGVSAGKYEVKKVPIEEALSQIGQISQMCSEKDFSQESLDREISSHGFGGNSTLAISAAFFKRELQDSKMVVNSLPKLMHLVFEGGEHGDKEHISVQEFMIIEESVPEAFTNYALLKKYFHENNIEVTVGDEGGFSPSTFDNIKVLETIKTVFPEKKIALDVADTFKAGQSLDYDTVVTNFNIASIEDPYDDDSWDKWQEFYQKFNDRIMVVGDDLTVTNTQRIQEAIDKKTINAVIIKPNQIGTITQALEAVALAKANGLKIVVSHRGQETNDAWIADFAVFCEADFVKFGGLDRGERIAKYNRLIELSQI